MEYMLITIGRVIIKNKFLLEKQLSGGVPKHSCSRTFHKTVTKTPRTEFYKKKHIKLPKLSKRNGVTFLHRIFQNHVLFDLH